MDFVTIARRMDFVFYYPLSCTEQCLNRKENCFDFSWGNVVIKKECFRNAVYRAAGERLCVVYNALQKCLLLSRIKMQG